MASKDHPPLPAAIGDIPPSGVRRRPLSAAELRDVRALVGAAKGGTADAPSAPAPQPLAGRRAMVPATSKAFFEGELRPPSETASDPSKPDAMGERVGVNEGGKLVEMTRAEADALFGRQQEKMAAKTKSTSSATTSNPKKEAPASTKTDASREVQTGPTLPLMEIRETCDASGNIVGSEIVNISNAAKRLDEGLKNIGESGGGEEDEAQLGEMIAQTLNEGAGDITRNAHVSKVEAGPMEIEYERQEAAKESQQETVSDAAYEAICSRLEELERLEEEEARSKKANAKNSKRLQSSGWSKGFLNQPKKKAPGKKESSVAKHSASGNSSAETGAACSKNGTTATVEGADLTEKVSKVSFGGDEVKEIPRIGQSKVPPRPTSSNRPVSFSPTNLDVPETDPYSPVTSVPFEANVFKGVVKERSAMAPDAGTTENRAGGKKKLSRFAQQRLQRE
ncbi:hypothetical protein ACHAXT_010601 [Thalassiosira profunda]